jgi:hypothetical protein
MQIGSPIQVGLVALMASGPVILVQVQGSVYDVVNLEGGVIALECVKLDGVVVAGPGMIKVATIKVHIQVGRMCCVGHGFRTRESMSESG